MIFKAGTELENVTFLDEYVLESKDTDFGIFVTMVNGQMAEVPWATYSVNGNKHVVNLANVQVVTVK
ncbi:MAG: hypothetical protein CL489_08455 [Acidobacteria bacterium]|nr:hypothetical protein [Acidobacteriota bacterium]|tara:strand:- start:52812 stop:53012 length:201 start_codon:yes stop_codon:yes gene_type:complete